MGRDAVYVVVDEPELLVVYTPERAPFGFAEPPVVGRHGRGKAATIRAEAERVERDLRENGNWWGEEWAAWFPPRDWSAPPLEPSWHLEPTSP